MADQSVLAPRHWRPGIRPKALLVGMFTVRSSGGGGGGELPRGLPVTLKVSSVVAWSEGLVVDVGC